jgi:undecaprenyl-diphosphatase
VSSTGHLFLFSHFFPFQGLGDISEAFEDLYDIFIQTGAILSVLFLYYKKFYNHGLETYAYLRGKSADKSGFDFYRNILVGIFPILVLGFAFKSVLDTIKSSESLLLILGSSWLVGGLIMIFIEWSRGNSTTEDPSRPLGIRESIWIGFFQCFALIPGVSRSAATIITARALGVSKKDSAEFSFFLALPVLTLAGFYKLYKHRQVLNTETIGILLFGSIVSFLICYFIIRLFIAFLRRRSFLSFGVYRVILGILVILYFITNLN